MTHRARPLTFAVSVVAAAFLVLPGCSKHKHSASHQTAGASAGKTGQAATGGSATHDAAAHAAAQAAGATATPPHSAAANGAPTVKLLSPGVKPRAPLRYALKVGDKEEAVVTMHMQKKVEMTNLLAPPVKLPGLSMHVKIRVEKKVHDGMRYKFALTKLDLVDTKGVSPMVLDAMQKGVKRAIDMKGSAVVDARGFQHDEKVDMPSGLAPEIRQMVASSKHTIEHLCSPLPAEPIGVGASWEVDRRVKQNGMTVDHTTTYKLAKLAGHVATLEATVSQEADQQKIKMPGVPSRAHAELLSLHTSGNGDTSIDLAHLIPKQSHLALQSDSSFQMGPKGRKLSTHMQVDIGIKRTK